VSCASLCPTCHRRFDEPGFCPFDGTPLAPDIAADQDRTTQHEPRHETLPLTPSPVVRADENPDAARERSGTPPTGSPVYALAALPPGADPGLVPPVPAMPLQSFDADLPASQARALPGTPRARTAPTTHRIHNEPEFTAGDRAPSFQQVSTGALASPRTRRWPRPLLLALIASGVAGAVVLALVVMSRHDGVVGRNRDTSLVARPSDAGIRQAPQAPIDVVPDATELIALPDPDAGERARPLAPADAGAAPETPNDRRTVVVQVVTRPGGASLYEDGRYRGSSGTEIKAPLGTRRVLTCRQPGYKPGSVEIHFNGTTTIATCVMQRIKICIDGIKNPFDDCEIDPASPATPAQQPPGRTGSPTGAPSDDPAALIDPDPAAPPRRSP